MYLPARSTQNKTMTIADATCPVQRAGNERPHNAASLTRVTTQPECHPPVWLTAVAARPTSTIRPAAVTDRDRPGRGRLTDASTVRRPTAAAIGRPQRSGVVDDVDRATSTAPARIAIHFKTSVAISVRLSPTAASKPPTSRPARMRTFFQPDVRLGDVAGERLITG